MESTKQRIRRELIAMLRTREIAAIKVTELAERAQVSRSTFYTYYDSVYAVLQEVEDEHFKQFESVLARSAAVPFDDRYFEQPNPQFTDAMRFLYEQQDVVAALCGPRGDGLFQESSRQLIRRSIYDKALREHYIRSGSELRAAFWVGGLEHQIAYWMRNQLDLTPEDMAIIAYRLIFGSKFWPVGGLERPLRVGRTPAADAVTGGVEPQARR